MEISVTLSGLEAGRAFTCSLTSFSRHPSLGMRIAMTCSEYTLGRFIVTHSRRKDGILAWTRFSVY